ncbi:sigma 54-interacting transcriptional regulator [Bacillus aquiflavi]|uniref:PAS domain S-box protein n=1 Tax=Bacillus aquiflavi TaxID=2672567 RepID=A0A6B3W213_9BACI|nr:sigma 54-interacting transcriptional regulator [Bacillus aquiflavi]MBA4537757.1 sigma 54-interacting transcriptional regulator [Bacillus aquiflavi]NEY82013.1 PAS domain S-box protein [Bacillus aquiflavi]UAC46942.1 sigma 54-interacting transcriptional regulator [Bacillus aquiflavi]
MNETINVTKEMLTAILNGIDEGIHAVDTDGTTIFYNEIAAKHDGMTVEEVLGKPLLTVFPSLTEETSTLLKVMKSKQPIYHRTQSYVNIHGEKIETINTTLPIFVKKKIIGAVEIAKDYSKLKLLSERLLDLQSTAMNISAKPTEHRGTKYTFHHLMTRNQEFQAMKDEAERLSKSDSPILVYGESGSGKELFVQGIHSTSRRNKGPFIAQNCAALPESLLESILFGTVKGSYTGAVDRPGLFELAHGGTLFLDELHAMPFELQAKLLRVLEDGIVRRVGSTKSLAVDVRIIAAMNEHPQKVLQEEKLRSDLFYRLNVLTFELMPLRKRKEDISLLTNHFISTFNNQLNKHIKGTNKAVAKLFRRYPWPGNVRELKHTIEYMMNVCNQQYLTEDDLPFMLKDELQKAEKVKKDMSNLSLRKNVINLEKKLIYGALEETDGNVLQAAKLLQIPRQTLQYKIQKYEINYAH